jgi:hypothetical protein
MTMLVSHCGWNSMLEATTGGMPMVMCPLHTEQRMNNVVLSEIVSVVLCPRVRAGRVVPQEEVEALVRELMEGSEKVHIVWCEDGYLQQAVVKMKAIVLIVVGDEGGGA